MSSNFAIPFGYRPNGKFAAYTDNRHLVTFGPTRSGKGSTVIVQALLQVPHSVICVDPKGQNAAIAARQRRAMGQDVHFLNPFDELDLGTSRFNPLAHLSIDDPNIVADVAALAEALIVNEGQKDPHWANSSRSLVATLILHLLEKKQELGARPVTLPAMRTLLTQVGDEFTATVRKMVASDHPFISQPAGRFARDTNEMASVLSDAITQTAFLDHPAIADPKTGVLTGSDFFMADLKARPTTLFLILPGRYMEAYARFFRLLITSAIDQLTARPGGHRTLFILDEFATLQNLAAIAKAFGFAAGYNVQLWPFLQDLPQLKALYEERWESFLANAGLVQFFTPGDLTTAEYVQRRGGMLTVVKPTESQSTGRSEPINTSNTQGGSITTGTQYSKIEMREALIPVEDLMSMSATQQLVFFAQTHSPLLTTRFPYWDIPRLRGLWDVDPFHG